MTQRTLFFVRPILVFVLAFMVSPLVHAAPVVTLNVNPKTGTAPYPATVTWSVTGAVSCAASDGWTGTKALTGTQSVSVTANTKYTITCLANDGTATVRWTAPTTNTDGTAVTLSGFNIYRGTTAAAQVKVKSGVLPAATSYLDSGLAPGTYFYTVTATGDSLSESVPSTPPAVITVAGSSTAASTTAAVTSIPNPPTNVTVSDTVAYEIRKNSTGVLAATRIGVIPLGSLCSQDTRVVSGVTYNRVDPRSVDFTTIPAVTPPGEIFARCTGA